VLQIRTFMRPPFSPRAGVFPCEIFRAALEACSNCRSGAIPANDAFSSRFRYSVLCEEAWLRQRALGVSVALKRARLMVGKNAEPASRYTR